LKYGGTLGTELSYCQVVSVSGAPREGQAFWRMEWKASAGNGALQSDHQDHLGMEMEMDVEVKVVVELVMEMEMAEEVSHSRHES